MALADKIIEVFKKYKIETTRELDLQIGETPIKGTVKTTRKLAE
jgi:hypothetical protein